MEPDSPWRCQLKGEWQQFQDVARENPNRSEERFSLRGKRSWTRLPKGAVDSLSLELLNLTGQGPHEPSLRDTPLRGKLKKMDHFNLNGSLILFFKS